MKFFSKIITTTSSHVSGNTIATCNVTQFYPTATKKLLQDFRFFPRRFSNLICYKQSSHLKFVKVMSVAMKFSIISITTMTSHVSGKQSKPVTSHPLILRTQKGTSEYNFLAPIISITIAK